jgi:hypothetical protein
MNLLKTLLETAEEKKLTDDLVGKVLTFKDPNLKMKVDFRIEKAIKRAGFSRDSMNVNIYLRGLSAKGSLNRDAMDEKSPKHKTAKEIKMALLRGHFHGEEVPSAVMKDYMAHYFHPYGNEEFCAAIQKLLGEGHKVQWSENGLQGHDYVNVDIALDEKKLKESKMKIKDIFENDDSLNENEGAKLDVGVGEYTLPYKGWIGGESTKGQWGFIVDQKRFNSPPAPKNLKVKVTKVTPTKVYFEVLEDFTVSQYKFNPFGRNSRSGEKTGKMYHEKAMNFSWVVSRIAQKDKDGNDVWA